MGGYLAIVASHTVNGVAAIHSELIKKTIGTDQWVMNLDLLSKLEAKAKDPDLQQKWRDVKIIAKKKLAQVIEDTVGLKVQTDAMFDVHVKRIHEYKRQTLNIFGVIHRYDKIKNMTVE